MELFIETLTGTSFQLRVCPYETVISVKDKIQRLEGIPVSQQHLIWNSMELEDEYYLRHYNITEGCTLKLVLAMRGGPINTRRVTVDDYVKEMADCLDSARDEVWEKTLPNKQVTFLVYRKGDQLNFFRVVERGDGTLTPVSESVSGGSVHNVYSEEDEEAESSSSRQLTLENSITMSKMKLLKTRMENMNLNRKPKKMAKLKIRPPTGPRSSSGPSGPDQQHHLLRLIPQIGPPSSTHLPPIADQPQPAAPPAAAGSSHLTLSSVAGHAPSHRIPSSLAYPNCQMLQVEEQRDWSTFNKVCPPSKVSKLGRAKGVTDSVCPSFPFLSSRAISDASVDDLGLHSNAVKPAENLVLLDPSKAVHCSDILPEQLSMDLASQCEASLDSVRTRPEPAAAAHLLSPSITQNPLSTWAIGADQLTSKPDLAPLDSLNLPNRPVSPSRSPQPCELTLGMHSTTPPLHHLLRPDPNSHRARTPSQTASVPLRSIRLDPPCKRSDDSSRGEACNIAKLVNQGLKESLGAVRASALSGLGRAEGLSNPHMPPSLTTSFTLLRRPLPPPHRTTPSQHVSSNIPGASAGHSCSGKRLGTPSYHLPPVKAPVSSKKKNSKHCFLCGKKTGLATSYECRCGNNFCSTHRYAETHDCTFNYKTAGRRFLQETNPVVSAPKLPKI
ncbi:AN1-type zinc finger protein 4 [Chanos chanos]|uniref:AN1-type zinc finger protein 4 n=1 Tax=Chanos chanos TaxID=29144 RepID=A0A6J2V5F6_CHACN|nr:AN1-type zinc finger protein 4 [Chanos chanos]